MTGVVIILIFIVIWCAVGYYISRQKGRSPAEGCTLGCLLGPLGWLIAAVLPARGPRGRGYATDWPPPIGPPPRNVSDPGEVQLLPLPDPRDVRYIDRRDLDGSEAGVVAQARELAARMSSEQGWVVSEAAWQDPDHLRLGLAFGLPGVVYLRQWPGLDDVRVGMLADQAAAESLPGLVGSTTAGHPPGAAVAEDSRASQGPDRPAKICPDCAETILADARICRFCRHEFWPAAPGPGESADSAAQARGAETAAGAGTVPDAATTEGTSRAAANEGTRPPPVAAGPVEERPMSDGPPPMIRHYAGLSGGDCLRQLDEDAQRIAAHARLVVVEAVWAPGQAPVINAAFGQPGRRYDRVWPDRRPVRQ